MPSKRLKRTGTGAVRAETGDPRSRRQRPSKGWALRAAPVHQASADTVWRRSATVDVVRRWWRDSSAAAPAHSVVPAASRAIILNQDVLYEIRGPVHQHAARLEAEGHRILKLNIGNPAPFGFEAPDVIMRE